MITLRVAMFVATPLSGGALAGNPFGGCKPGVAVEVKPGSVLALITPGVAFPIKLWNVDVAPVVELFDSVLVSNAVVPDGGMVKPSLTTLSVSVTALDDVLLTSS